MTKKEQQRIAQEEMNRLIEKAIHDFNAETVNSSIWSESEQLRSCNAKVYTGGNYYVLQSYNTVVAFIDRRADCLYDVLRLVYGYTSTSAQHISKFEHDYCAGDWRCKARYTWRAC